MRTQYRVTGENPTDDYYTNYYSEAIGRYNFMLSRGGVVMLETNGKNNEIVVLHKRKLK